MSAGECRRAGHEPAEGGVRFNEAPACLPGNVPGEEVPAPQVDRASMRPRHVCRGMDAALETLYREAVGASMRPRHVCRGMAETPRASCRRQIALQ